VGAEKTLKQARAGSRNLRFVDACRLAEAFGFRSTRIKGSHHIYSHPTIPELVNLQSVNGTAKPYQIRQLLDLVERYNLKLEGEP
jgi:predicted RNA binding protein YcfA (HicA-like mRNA interferase family)